MADGGIGTGVLEGLSPIAPFITLGVGAWITFVLHRSRAKDKKGRDDALKLAVSNNVRDLVEIFEGINSRAEKITDGGLPEAERASEYFGRKLNRMELIRINAGTLLAHLDPKDEFARGANVILGVGAWMADAYHDPARSEADRLHAWESTNLDLERQVRKAVEAAQDLGIIKPIVVD